MAETVGAVLVAEGCILLGPRAAQKSFARCWDIIGGYIERGEREWSARQRELSEELEIKCDEGQRLGSLTLLDAKRRSSIVHVYSIRL